MRTTSRACSRMPASFGRAARSRRRSPARASSMTCRRAGYSASFCWSFTEGQPIRGDGTATDTAVAHHLDKLSAASNSSVQRWRTPGSRRSASSTVTWRGSGATPRDDGSSSRATGARGVGMKASTSRKEAIPCTTPSPFMDLQLRHHEEGPRLALMRTASNMPSTTTRPAGRPRNPRSLGTETRLGEASEFQLQGTCGGAEKEGITEARAIALMLAEPINGQTTVLAFGDRLAAVGFDAREYIGAGDAVRRIDALQCSAPGQPTGPWPFPILREPHRLVLPACLRIRMQDECAVASAAREWVHGDDAGHEGDPFRGEAGLQRVGRPGGCSGTTCRKHPAPLCARS